MRTITSILATLAVLPAARPLPPLADAAGHVPANGPVSWSSPVNTFDRLSLAIASVLVAPVALAQDETPTDDGTLLGIRAGF